MATVPSCSGVHEENTEQVQASGSTGVVTWDGVEWVGGGTGSASVTPLNHGVFVRDCGNTCSCSNDPNCIGKQCCGDSFFGPRWHAHHGTWLAYDRADIIRDQVVFCPSCCAPSDPIPTGYNGAEWCCLVGLKVSYGCFDFSGLPGFPLNCSCPSLPPPVGHGYTLFAQLLVRTQRLQASVGSDCVGDSAGFLGFPQQPSFTMHKGVWTKPCCSANDSVRGTYRLALPQTATGQTGFPTYSWMTTRSLTATVS